MRTHHVPASAAIATHISTVVDFSRRKEEPGVEISTKSEQRNRLSAFPETAKGARMSTSRVLYTYSIKALVRTAYKGSKQTHLRVGVRLGIREAATSLGTGVIYIECQSICKTTYGNGRKQAYLETDDRAETSKGRSDLKQQTQSSHPSKNSKDV